MFSLLKKRREDAYALRKLSRNKTGARRIISQHVLRECDASSHRFNYLKPSVAQPDSDAALNSIVYNRTCCASLAGIQPRKVFGSSA
jgi:hypothetical protein